MASLDAEAAKRAAQQARSAELATPEAQTSSLPGSSEFHAKQAPEKTNDTGLRPQVGRRVEDSSFPRISFPAPPPLVTAPPPRGFGEHIAPGAAPPKPKAPPPQEAAPEPADPSDGTAWSLERTNLFLAPAERTKTRAPETALPIPVASARNMTKPLAKHGEQLTSDRFLDAFESVLLDQLDLYPKEKEWLGRFNAALAGEHGRRRRAPPLGV